MAATPPIHPFPARMAAELALTALRRLPPGSRVLDPMAGSGTVLRAAADQGHTALGFDTDPLAVLMARVWTTPLDPARLRVAAVAVAEEARALPTDIALPWIDDDRETRDFTHFWFGALQRQDLRRLAFILHRREPDDPLTDALRIALSRIIVTKERGASLARDVSHSRPHRAFGEHDFAVLPAFIRSAEQIGARLRASPPPAGVTVRRGDARRLDAVEAASIDAAITSPPYLNAIDYLRGHRLALVWLGHRLGELRAIRAGNIGSERAPAADADRIMAAEITAAADVIAALPARPRRMVDRYALDLAGALAELHRVVRRDGQVICVVGNSCLRDVFIENDRLVIAAAERAGFRLTGWHSRELPPARRYLPPPTRGVSTLTKRMRTESVLTFLHP
jgi:DNA modification methylase